MRFFVLGFDGQPCWIKIHGASKKREIVATTTDGRKLGRYIEIKKEV